MGIFNTLKTLKADSHFDLQTVYVHMYVYTQL